MVVRLMMINPMGSQYKLHKTIKPRIQTASPVVFCAFRSSSLLTQFGKPRFFGGSLELCPSAPNTLLEGV